MKSIRFKLWAGMMVLVGMVLILLWLFQIVFLESFYTRMSISDLKKEVLSINKSLENGNQEEFESKLEAFAFHKNLSIELFDLNKTSIYTANFTSTGGQMGMMKNGVKAEVFERVLAGEEVAIPLNHPRFGNKFMMLGLPVKILGEVSGVAIMNMPLAPVEDTVGILKRQLIYITLILLGASLLISFIISRSFTRPILEIQKASQIMAAGDFSARIKSKKQDEIGKLAETINHMGDQLSKIEQLRKDLIANVSHELRTPLSLIRGYAETIRDVTGNHSDKREKQLEIIIEEAERLSKIVDDILNLSQLQSGYFQLNKSNFKIHQLLDAIAKRYDILSEKTGVRLVQAESVDAIVQADQVRIGQVLYNLINNAFNNTPEFGVITLRALDENEEVRIEISDTGRGISQGELPYIWGRYYKVENTSGKKTTGTGLGLAIVKGVLEAHEADYGVESEINQGTTFWFKLKKAKQ